MEEGKTCQMAQRLGHLASGRRLFFFEAELVEFEGAAVFADGAHGVIVEALGVVGADFQSDADVGVGKAGKVLQDLVYDGFEVFVNALGVHLHAAVVVSDFIGG